NPAPKDRPQGQDANAPPATESAESNEGALSIVFDADFKTAWTDWTSVIRRSIDGRACPMTEKEYRAGHRLLLEKCKQYIASSQGRQRKIFEWLESVIEPWLSLRTFATANQATLESLWNNCLAFEHECPSLSTSEAPRSSPWIAVIVAGAVTVLICWLLLRLW